MFIFKLTYKMPLSEVESHLQAHRDYLDEFYRAGIFVVSGPREPRTGGIIICNVRNSDEAHEIISKDPFFIHGIAEYEVIEFHATKHNVDNFKAGLE